MGEPRIRLQNISKYYYSETSVTRALHNIDLDFGENGFVAVTGESGSGKSTLLKVISGMEEFDEGELFLDGRPASQFDDEDWEQCRREKIGYIFQDYSLIWHYSVRHNIVSALMIMGLPYRQAVQKADPYLERVGLKGLEKRRASRLSSGQKQRLSIARALAKGTELIVADEPTGNLDSETGEQIVRLLQDLSQDHLVIMVTHNYEQVEPYITRKIRLHDGEVVEDVETIGREIGGNGKSPQNEGLPENDGEDLSVKQDKYMGVNRGGDLSVKQDRKCFHRAASFLAGMNILTQPGMTLLFLFFFTAIATLSFYFIGEILINADERIAMEYDNSAFPREDRTRIIAKHHDGKPITEQDADAIRAMKHVVLVDQYDNVNDVNYYYREDEDYRHLYSDIYDEEWEEGHEESIEFLDDSHFMRSSTCISEKDLAAGKLPESRNGVVLYSEEGEDAIGSAFVCYLRNEPLWGNGEYVRRAFTVVGVLREKTEQVYFSPAMCQMLTVMLDSEQYKYTMVFNFDMRQGKFLGKEDFIPLIGEGLKDDELQVSRHYIVPIGSGSSEDPRGVFGGSGYLEYHDYLEILRKSDLGEWQEPIKLNGQNVLIENLHYSSGAFLAMSEEWFAQYNDMNTYQASVYISSYAKTAEVLQALQDAGYDAISTYRTSTREYDARKVQKRLSHIAIASAVLLVMMVAEVLLLGSLMKLRRKDYLVWTSMGMDRKSMCRIGFYEMGVYLLVAMILAPVIMGYVSTRFSYIHEMWYYYELPGWLGFAAYNLVAAVLTVAGFYFRLEFDRNAY